VGAFKRVLLEITAPNHSMLGSYLIYIDPAPYLEYQAQNHQSELLPANFRARHKIYKYNIVPDTGPQIPRLGRRGERRRSPSDLEPDKIWPIKKISRICLIAGCNILSNSNSTSNNRNRPAPTRIPEFPTTESGRSHEHDSMYSGLSCRCAECRYP
jgi:hypothetical protein